MKDTRLANLLGAMALALVDVIDEADGLVRNHNVALNVVAHSPGCSVKYLADVLDLSHPAAVRLVDSLERNGLVERASGPNGRTVSLHLTPQGRTTWRELKAHRLEHLLKILESLSATDRECLEKTVIPILKNLTTGPQRGEMICRACDESACPQNSCPVTIAAKSR